ncbi:hypothetical protein [Sphingomonas sp.]|jgi:hypothetical protein|uniref:hypothetical protein n=1 Tax=Sphingomonas sp. TaxID=28214 RepID=UPI002DEA3C41|nr:hypothetical protein [Sphingomonas sp.]
MSMMEVGAERGRFAVPAGVRDTTEFFDTLYCLTPQDLERLPDGDEAALTAAAVLLATAQEFVVDGLADLFPFWRQPVSDRVALAVLAFTAIRIERASARELPGRARFDAINGGLEIICGFAAQVAETDLRPELAYLTHSFDAARRSGLPDEPARLLRSALMELLVDPAHLPAHGMRVALLVRTAVEWLQQDLAPAAAHRLAACWPGTATDCDNIVRRLTKAGDASVR